MEMEMENASINFKGPKEVVRAMQLLLGQVEVCLQPYGAKVISITTSDTSSLNPVRPTNNPVIPTKVEVNPNNQQEFPEIEPMFLGTDGLKELSNMCENLCDLSEEELYEVSEVPAGAPTPTPIPSPVINKKVASVNVVANPPVPTTKIDYDLLAIFERVLTWADDGGKDKSNRAVKVLSRLEEGYKLIAVTMAKPMSPYQVKSYLGFVGARVGIDMSTDKVYFDYELVTDGLSTASTRLADNRHFMIKVKVKEVVTESQSQYAYTH